MATNKNPSTVSLQPEPKFFPNEPASSLQQALANAKKQVDQAAKQ
jgi:hypothetical protein